MLARLRQIKHKWQLRNNQRLVESFRGKHRGQRCFIVGNGPSLKIPDLERLQGEISFATNKIYLCFHETEWRPTYYVAEDDKIIRENVSCINKIRGPQKLLRKLETIHYKQKERVAEFEMYFPDATNYPQFTVDASAPLACGYTVTYVALQWAFFMGFRSVYLLGIDFSYPGLKYNPDGTVELPHEGTHFTKNYGNSGETFWAPKLEENLKAYQMAKRVFESDGKEVFNATRGGHLEVFERVDFDSLF